MKKRIKTIKIKIKKSVRAKKGKIEKPAKKTPEKIVKKIIKKSVQKPVQKIVSVKTRKTSSPDVVAAGGAKSWVYADAVKDHFYNPQNFLREGEENEYAFNGVGMVGSPACGDMMKFWIQVDPKTERIKLCKWKTFGCASAIASTSMLSVMVTENGGMEIEKAIKLKPQDILVRLGGLPSNKIHCSVLGDKALRAAINDYFRKSGQYDRITTDGSKIVDEKLKITEKDIEQAVIDGAKTLEDLQAMLKIGVENPSCLPDAEQILRFYRDKHGK